MTRLRCSSVAALWPAQEDAFFLEGRQELLAQAGIRFGQHLANGLTDAVDLLAGRHAVRAGTDQDPGRHLLLEAAHPDHEELIEIGREDRQKLQALEERHRRIKGLLQDATIELQPAQLPVDIEGRVVQAN